MYSIGGLILDLAVARYDGIAVFQPVVNGNRYTSRLLLSSGKSMPKRNSCVANYLNFCLNIGPVVELRRASGGPGHP